MLYYSILLYCRRLINDDIDIPTVLANLDSCITLSHCSVYLLIK